MGNFFPRWVNWIPLKVVFCLSVVGMLLVPTVWYTATAKYTRVGYQPQQPIPFDHNIHAGQLGMDCRYCHSFVENSKHSNVPVAEQCWNCHKAIQTNKDKLVKLREAADKNYEGYTGERLKWVQIHETPDYAYFDHSVHVNRGVSCVECHGKVNEMKVVHQEKSLSMGFCLDCHRNPEKHLRPMSEITNLNWKAEDVDRHEFFKYLAEKTGKSASDFADEYKKKGEDKPLTRKDIGKELKAAWNVNPPESCTACHR